MARSKVFGTAEVFAAPKWEYKMLVLGMDEPRSEAQLNRYGEDGWELVGLGGRFQEAQYAYMKRAV